MSRERVTPAQQVDQALAALHRARRPLHRELVDLERRGGVPAEVPPHLCCQRSHNQMRISTLEALNIARALLHSPKLRPFLPRVRERVLRERKRLRDNERRQNYDCPLLEGTRCLVHDIAKPIGCLAWNPGHEISRRGWRAFSIRDRLNLQSMGRRWELKAIPILLEKALGVETARMAKRSRDRE